MKTGKTNEKVTAKLWFEDLNTWYLATALMKAHVEEYTAVRNNILSPFFDENKKRFLVVFIFLNTF